MGEAKRRRQTGTTYDAGPVEQFRVPDGKLGITISVDDKAPSTVLFDADKITDMMAEAGRHLAGQDYYKTLRCAPAAFLDTRQRHGDLTGVGILILWTALYHPRSGADMRAKVSRALREKNSAHLTWKFSRTHGLAIALASQFLDLDNIIAKAPRDQQVMVTFPQTPEPKPQ
jgi:hypothetical protein